MRVDGAKPSILIKRPIQLIRNENNKNGFSNYIVILSSLLFPLAIHLIQSVCNTLGIFMAKGPSDFPKSKDEN